MSSHATTSIEQATWRIDPDRSSVAFHVKHFWGLATVKGAFARYEGTLDLSDTIELTVDADSLDTNHAKRDKHLRSDDFFGVEQHPTIHFVSSRATLDGEHLHVHGQLDACGVSLPLDVSATLRRRDEELEIEAIAVVDRRRLGMTWSPLGMVGKASTLIVKGRLVR
jgi:polyisoprenoid-binding protein YceI